VVWLQGLDVDSGCAEQRGHASIGHERRLLSSHVAAQRTPDGAEHRRKGHWPKPGQVGRDESITIFTHNNDRITVQETRSRSEVAVRFGTSRQSPHSWRRRFQQEGMPGLADRSRRPRSSPSRLAAEVEALICQLRRLHPRCGCSADQVRAGAAGSGCGAVAGHGAPGADPQWSDRCAGPAAQTKVQALAAAGADASVAAGHRRRGAAG